MDVVQNRLRKVLFFFFLFSKTKTKKTDWEYIPLVQEGGVFFPFIKKSNVNIKRKPVRHCELHLCRTAGFQIHNNNNVI